MMRHAYKNWRLVCYTPEVGLSLLFRLLQKAARGKLDVTYVPKKGGTIWRFRGPDALGVPEQTLLMGLLIIAEERYAQDPKGSLLDIGSTNPIWAERSKNLFPEHPGVGLQTVCFDTTWYELATRCGLTHGGSVQDAVQKQLQRLCETTVWTYETGDEPGPPAHQSFLVTWVNGTSRRVHLALNRELVTGLLGERRYCSISLAERLSLPSDAAKAAHAFLSSVLKQGYRLEIGVGTLVARLFQDNGPKVTNGTLRKRQKAIRDALNAIGQLEGWRVEPRDGEKFYVKRRASEVAARRSARRVTEMTSHNAPKCASSKSASVLNNDNQLNDLREYDVSGLFSTRE